MLPPWAEVIYATTYSLEIKSMKDSNPSGPVNSSVATDVAEKARYSILAAVEHEIRALGGLTPTFIGPLYLFTKGTKSLAAITHCWAAGFVEDAEILSRTLLESVITMYWLAEDLDYRNHVWREFWGKRFRSLERLRQDVDREFSIVRDSSDEQTRALLMERAVQTYLARDKHQRYPENVPERLRQFTLHEFHKLAWYLDYARASDLVHSTPICLQSYVRLVESKPVLCCDPAKGGDWTTLWRACDYYIFLSLGLWRATRIKIYDAVLEARSVVRHGFGFKERNSTGFAREEDSQQPD